MSRVGRIVFMATAIVGVFATAANFFFPGSADSSQASAVTFLFFALLLGGIAGLDALVRRFANPSYY